MTLLYSHSHKRQHCIDAKSNSSGHRLARSGSNFSVYYLHDSVRVNDSTSLIWLLQGSYVFIS